MIQQSLSKVYVSNNNSGDTHKSKVCETEVLQGVIFARI